MYAYHNDKQNEMVIRKKQQNDVGFREYVLFI